MSRHCRASGARLGASERFWLGLLMDYDLEEARNAIGRDISNIDRIVA